MKQQREFTQWQDAQRLGYELTGESYLARDEKRPGPSDIKFLVSWEDGKKSEVDGLTLLELAQQFDRIDPANFEARLPPAEKIKTLLASRYEEFDERYGRLVDARPEHPTPAETVMREMGLAECQAPKAKE